MIDGRAEITEIVRSTVSAREDEVLTKVRTPKANIQMRRIVSFSLFNDFELYNAGALKNAELVHAVYPGWAARFYIDHTVRPDIQSALRERGAEIVVVDAPSLGPQYGKHWRFWVAEDTDVERFIIRDADSRLNPREAAAVEEWIASGKPFHTMRDAVWHSTRVLGGMWGAVDRPPLSGPIGMLV